MEWFFLALLSVIVLICAAVLLLDAVPLLIRWYERIHIGQWSGRDEWKKAVCTVNTKWLIKTPTVKLTDNTRLTVIDRAKGCYKNSRLQSWQKAALLLAAKDDEAQRFIDSTVDSKGKWRELVQSPDAAMLAWAVLIRTTEKNQVKPAMDETAKMLFDMAKASGTVPYNGSISQKRFVDTIGMICPFLFEYDRVYGCEAAAQLAERQLEEYWSRGMHDGLLVPYHAFDMLNGAPAGICGWGRGCGWMALGLAGSIKACKENEFKARLLELSEEYAEALLKFCLKDGSWSRQIFAEYSGEASATAMIGNFMAELYSLTGKDIYLNAAEGAISFLQGVTRKNGKVDMAQGDTKSIGFYADALDTMPAAQGFAALLAIKLSE